MARYFPPQRNFYSLSVKDLLEARDAYHVHLTHMENVVATAIGRFRFRNEDEEEGTKRIPAAEPRTLAGSYVSAKSWPAVLVFTVNWKKLEKIAPDELVPQFLYLPDGRVVPTCVIQAELQDYTPSVSTPSFNSNVIGGGCPVLTDIQGATRVGTLACLVTDGKRIYGLTNHHVAAEKGTRIYTYVDNKLVELGEACGQHRRNADFCDVYPDWPGNNTVCTLDVGLIEIKNLYQWTAQSYLGELNRVADLHQSTISLDLIGCKLRAWGGVSKEVSGEIHALFYRHKCMGGIDYVADVLVGPCRGEEDNCRVAPGDSGALWLYEDTEDVPTDEPTQGMRAKRLRPVAMQWGGHELFTGDGHKTSQYSLATFLARVCSLMDIEIVRGWNIGHTERWGQRGHYHIAETACGLVKDPRLKELLGKNMPRIARDARVKKNEYDKFCPLADVPDLVWRNDKSNRARDGACHFADMDEMANGTTLMKMCYSEKRIIPENVDAAVWYNFYNAIKDSLKRAAAKNGERAKPLQMGQLPFRVWQIYDEMVGFAQRKPAEFVCAAGILAHYVADACQPLHISRLHHGLSPAEKPVHDYMDNTLVDKKPGELWGHVAARLGAYQGAAIKNGKGAAAATIALMGRTEQTLAPKEVLSAFRKATKNGRTNSEMMWQALHKPMAACMAAGAATLAAIWDAAWKQGIGNKDPQYPLDAVPEDALSALYKNGQFLPSINLEQYAQDPKYAAPLQKNKKSAKPVAARARRTAKAKANGTTRKRRTTKR